MRVGPDSLVNFPFRIHKGGIILHAHSIVEIKEQNSIKVKRTETFMKEDNFSNYVIQISDSSVN